MSAVSGKQGNPRTRLLSLLSLAVITKADHCTAKMEGQGCVVGVGPENIQVDPSHHPVPNFSTLHGAGRRLGGKRGENVEGAERDLKDQLDTPAYRPEPPACASPHGRGGQVQERSQKEHRTSQARLKCS